MTRKSNRQVQKMRSFEVVIPGKTSLLVPPADPIALATAIRTLLDNPSLAQRLALNGRARVQRVTRVYDELPSHHEAPYDRH